MATPLIPTAPERRSRNLAEFVVDHIREQIASNAIKPGDKLPTESQLMTTLSVSRTVIREAISRLQAANVIETRHGIGSFVLEPRMDRLDLDMAPAHTMADVLSVMELRISLETECAGLAAQRAQPADVQRMREALDTLEAVRGAGLDSVEADFNFHSAIAFGSRNRYFVDILTQLGSTLIPRKRVDSAGIAHTEPEAYLVQVNMEHENILEAILRKDVEGARAAMRMHLSNSRERLRRSTTAKDASRN
ncbi:FadR/GntR family transcriptional regulator [Paraburkholderia tropica]|uniref:FadR/GntR family transcriptional regulator n=1 Tax=Paraburkholderia tropica TaxID=92647 RepID=UPI0015902FFD|nr:FadR/GntR family transcriptional regulator [Paraburkholderia tropica]